MSSPRKPEQRASQRIHCACLGVYVWVSGVGVCLEKNFRRENYSGEVANSFEVHRLMFDPSISLESVVLMSGNMIHQSPYPIPLVKAC
jgi:hypothetical protein